MIPPISEQPAFGTNQDRIILHQQWWNHTNEKRLALIYLPGSVTADHLDIDFAPQQVVQRKLQGAKDQYSQPKDTLVTAYVDFSTALIPAMLGARFECGGGTSWAIPQSGSIRELHIPLFNPHQPLFQSYIERVEAVLACWSWDTYLPANYAYLGPMDVLAGLLGPERLGLDLYEHPDYVKAKALEVAQFLIEMVRYELALFRQAGIKDGTPCAFNYWLPGDGYLYSEDFCALVSGKHYYEFFLEADIAFNQAVDSAFLHLHSAGLQCLPAILENPCLRGLEIANDANNRDIRKVIEAVKAVQAKGLPVQVSSWQHPLQPWEMELMLNELDRRGLLVALQARSVEEAEDLYWLIKDHPG